MRHVFLAVDFSEFEFAAVFLIYRLCLIALPLKTSRLYVCVYIYMCMCVYIYISEPVTS
jgi:hypothetical protein